MPSQRRSDEEWIREIERRSRGAAAGSPGVLWTDAREQILSRLSTRWRSSVSPEAIDKLVEAAGYRARRLGLESEFLAEVDCVLPLIGSSPTAFPRLLGVPADLVMRRALLPRFPYMLIFMDLGEHVRLLAVAHAKRRPGYWLDRV